MKYVLLLVLIFPTLSFADIYKWVDDKGRVHFGDSPKQEANAEKVSLRVNSYKHVTVESNDLFFQDASPSSQKVIMYSTTWCGYCKKAKRYFQENQISFVEYDIEEDLRAKQRFDALGGRGVPLILVGKQKMSGFDVPRFERMLSKR
ncbi:glutaredoxin domain-containing protein [Litoribrevibacter euphylliae]|uniref:Glutaredoxin domain-containing protein n=1 Tax=Litoribrevibacter euphylliae TaxID=1834034 RepID=A0ABV7HEA0_9GAMM